MMSLEEKEEGPEIVAGGVSVDGAEVFELEKEKRKLSLSYLENAAPGADENGNSSKIRKRNRRVWVNFFDKNGATRRILRSDVAKQREREEEAAMKKTLEDGTSGAELDGSTISNGTDEIKCEEEMKVQKRVLRLDIAKQRELTDTHVKKVMEESAVADDQNVSRTVINGSNGTEMITTCEGGIGVEKKRTEVDTDKEKVTEEDAIDEKIVTEKISPGTDQNKSSFSKENETEQIKCEDKITVDKERIMMLDVAGQMEGDGSDKVEVREEVDRDKEKITEEVDADKKTVTEEVAPEVDQNRDESSISKRNTREIMQFDEELKLEDNRNMSLDDTDQTEMIDLDNKGGREESVSGADCNSNMPVIFRRNVMEQINYKENIRVENRRVTRSSAAKQREEAGADKKRTTEEAAPGADQNENSSTFTGRNFMEKINCEEGIKIEKKRSAGSNISKQRGEPDNRKKKITGADQNVSNSTINKSNDSAMIKCKEIKVEKKRIMRSDVAKQKDEADTVKKKVMGSGFKRKRSREASDADITRKKIKNDTLNSRRDRNEETGGKKMKVDSSESQCSGPQPAVPVTKQKDGACAKRMQSKLRKGSRLKEKFRRSTSSGLKTLQILKDDAHLVDIKNIRVRGRGVLRFLPSNNKVGRFAKRPKTHIQREDEENWESLSLDTIVNHKSSSFSGERKILKKSSSFFSVGKCQLDMEKTSFEKNVSCEVDPKSLSPPKESQNMVSPGKIEVMVSGESKTPLLSKDKEAERIERSMAKQKLRNQIKDMLLDAGWKIELRPRAGKNYEDSVYRSPKGCGYWSITKAYAVFQKQLSHEHEGKDKDLSRKTIKKSQGAGYPSFSPIPMEVLSMLKKKICKRRSKKQLEETRTKLGDGRINKKMKKTTSIKYRKNKHIKDKSGKVKRRVKDNDTAGSSAKAVSKTRKKPHPGKYRKKQRGCVLLVRGSNQQAETGSDVYVPYVWKQTIFSWMIDLGIMPENARVKYMSYKHPQTLLEGHIKRDGIQCSCCSKILTVSKFEIHAGSKLCQPYQNIFVEEAGISLLQCQIDAWEKQESERMGFYSVDIHGDDPNDDTCGICGDGGDLICCDGCPSTFHLSCLGIKMLPPGDWHCMNCSCRYCGVISGDAAQVNGGTVSPLLSCSQCEEKYHQRCVPDGDAIPISSNLSYVPFCGQSCRQLFKQLQMLLGVKNDLDAGFSWTVVQRYDEDLSESVCGLDQRAECNSKIAVALAVMDECFLPIIDRRSGINLIHNVVYNCGSNFSRLNYRGFYTFILERDDEIISAASLRIHGARVAEMPFIGTRNIYRRQGMCRRLLNEIESTLCSLNIEKLIIPAISEMMDTWTNVFGFKALEVSQKQEIRSINMLVFPGTGLLQKPLLKKDSAERYITTDEVDKFEPESKHHHQPEAANESCVCAYVGPEPCISYDVMIQHTHEAKDVDATFPVSISCMNSSSEVSPEFSCTHESEFQDPEYKSSEAPAYEDLLMQPETVYHDEPMTGNNSHGKENQDCDAVPVCASSEHDFQISEDTPIQHDSEFQRDLPESPSADLPFMTGYVEQKPCAFGENSVQDHAPDIISSVYVGFDPNILSSCGVKSSEIPGDSPGSSDVAYSPTPDVGNHVLHMEVKDSAVSGFAASCASKEGIILENSPVATSHCSTVVSSENHAGECITDLNGFAPGCNDIISGGLSNKFIESTSVVVQHDLPMTNLTTVASPAEPSHSCCEGTHDANNSEDEISAVKPVHGFGECSIS